MLPFAFSFIIGNCWSISRNISGMKYIQAGSLGGVICGGVKRKVEGS